MKFKRLKSTSDEGFKTAWEIYEEAFPQEERRPLKEQISTLKNESYHCDIVIENEVCIGILFWWDIESFRYVDHFATASQLRNKGLGQLILNTFIKANNKSILLEVELPTSKLNERRIKFYERSGFVLNDHYYEIPNLINPNEPPAQLLLMSCPKEITSEEVAFFVEKYHPIFFQN